MPAKSSAPTPQSISALLGRAGFERAVVTKQGRHVAENTAGYHVHRFGGETRVNYWAATILPTVYVIESAAAERAEGRAMLKRYAAAIRAAGWAVREQEAFAYLAVTAPKTEG